MATPGGERMPPVRMFDPMLAPQSQRPVSAAAACAILGLALAGCAVGPRYQKPSATLEPFYSAAAVESRSASAPPPLESWWSGFNDPVLSRIVERALAQNLDLAAA